METLILWVLVLGFVGAFAMQVASRVRVIAVAPNTFSLDNLTFRLSRFLVDVVVQRRTIIERPLAGTAHALVFWGLDRKSTRLNSSHIQKSRMPSSA